MEDVKSLAKSFSQLKSGQSLTHTHTAAMWQPAAHSVCVIRLLHLCSPSAKQSFNFEEYNLSQSTLEQVRVRVSHLLQDGMICVFARHVVDTGILLLPAGVHGVRQGAGERGGRGGLAQHHLPLAASAPGRPRVRQPRGQHGAPALTCGTEPSPPPGGSHTLRHSECVHVCVCFSPSRDPRPPVLCGFSTALTEGRSPHADMKQTLLSHVLYFHKESAKKVVYGK